MFTEADASVDNDEINPSDFVSRSARKLALVCAGRHQVDAVAAVTNSHSDVRDDRLSASMSPLVVVFDIAPASNACVSTRHTKAAISNASSAVTNDQPDHTLGNLSGAQAALAVLLPKSGQTKCCLHEGGCNVTPSYNFPGCKGRIYCAAHRAEGMINMCKRPNPTGDHSSSRARRRKPDSGAESTGPADASESVLPLPIPFHRRVFITPGVCPRRSARSNSNAGEPEPAGTSNIEDVHPAAKVAATSDSTADILVTCSPLRGSGSCTAVVTADFRADHVESHDLFNISVASTFEHVSSADAHDADASNSNAHTALTEPTNTSQVQDAAAGVIAADADAERTPAPKSDSGIDTFDKSPPPSTIRGQKAVGISKSGKKRHYKICGHDGTCLATASFNYAGMRGIVCGAHRLQGMINVVSGSKCEFPKCSSIASFNFAEIRKSARCDLHALPGMLDAFRNKLEAPQSLLVPNSGSNHVSQKENRVKKIARTTSDVVSTGRRKRRRTHDDSIKACDKHHPALPSALTSDPIDDRTLDLANASGDSPLLPQAATQSSKKMAREKRICQHEAGCSLQPSFNYPGQTRSIFCSSHRMEGMVHRHKGKQRSATKRTLESNSSVSNHIDLDAPDNSSGASPADCIMIANASPSAAAAASGRRKRHQTSTLLPPSSKPSTAHVAHSSAASSSALVSSSPPRILFSQLSPSLFFVLSGSYRARR